jgi:hypothetical protein
VDNAGVTGVKVRKVLVFTDYNLGSAGNSAYALGIASGCGSSEVLLHAGFDATPNNALTLRESYTSGARTWN